jgi:hypothetical protein
MAFPLHPNRLHKCSRSHGFQHSHPLRVNGHLTKSLLDDFMSIFCKIQRGKFFAPEPADLRGVAVGFQLSSDRAAEEVNQHVVILHPAVRAAQDSVIDAEEIGSFDDQSCFFTGFSHPRVANQFADFEHASGNGPLALDRRMGALNQEDSGVFLSAWLDNDGANADEGMLGKFAFHLARILKHL